MRHILRLLLLLLVFVTQKPAEAQLLFNFNPAGLMGQPGDTLVFNATLANTGTAPVFLNGDSVNLASADLQIDDSPYFTNFPLFLAGGDSVTADIFTVFVGSNAANGIYGGSFQIVGGSDGAAQSIVGQQDFLVSVVPEPGTLTLLMGTAIFGTGLLSRPRKRS